MTTALQKLLQYPHGAVFDKRPVEASALTVDAAWSIADGWLTLGPPPAAGLALNGSTLALDGDELLLQVDVDIEPIDLSVHTLASLRSLLASFGLTVSSFAAGMGSLSALVLVEGAGAAGEPMAAYTSMLWVLLGGYAREILALRAAVPAALAQMDLNTAEDVWVDLHGALYGALSRRPGELDRPYADRIKAEALRLRVNKYGIEKAILDATGFVVTINEPWEEQFHLDYSVLSGSHRMYDGTTVGPHLIQPSGSLGVDWDAVLPVIERNKAAGIIVLEPVTHAVFGVDATASDQGVRFGASGSSVLATTTDDVARLDFMSLDADEHVPVHPSAMLTRQMISNGVAVPSLTWADVPGWAGGTWTATTYFAWASRKSSATEVLRYHVVYAGQMWDEDATWGTGGDWAGAVPRVTLLSSHTARPDNPAGTLALDDTPLTLGDTPLVLTS